MEGWYDHWLRTLHCAVITGPSDYGGLIEDVSPADMGGPRRRPCASLWQRLMVLCDGRVVSCEQDVLARQVMGTNLTEAWKNASAMRRDHTAGQWLKHPACAACKQWHRG
jgi:radical SAM protein with 4Fe4S-binding SPASM domain